MEALFTTTEIKEIYLEALTNADIKEIEEALTEMQKEML